MSTIRHFVWQLFPVRFSKTPSEAWKRNSTTSVWRHIRYSENHLSSKVSIESKNIFLTSFDLCQLAILFWLIFQKIPSNLYIQNTGFLFEKRIINKSFINYTSSLDIWITMVTSQHLAALHFEAYKRGMVSFSMYKL